MSDRQNEPAPASDLVQPSPATNTRTAGYVIFYGVFLIGMGLLGYLSNPEKAKTALMSGGTFGALSILWGVLMTRHIRWSLPAAKVTTGFLAIVFTWRASVSWLAVLDGKAEKQFAATLITVMLAGSIAMLIRLLKPRSASGLDIAARV